MRRIYHWCWQAIALVCGVVFTLNIEAVANKLGAGSVVGDNASLGQRAVMVVLGALRSPLALNVAMFLAGGSVFAWGLAFLKWYENLPGGHSVASVAARCKNVVMSLDGYWLAKYIANVPRQIEKTNEGLRAYNIAEVAVWDLNSKDDRKEAMRHFWALAEILARGDLENATAASHAIAQRRLALHEATERASGSTP